MSTSPEQQISTAIQEAIAGNEVILFMKGTPEAPRCGFSARSVAALEALGTPFAAVDILPDPRIRQELSALSNWPTIPQLFVRGELVGGCDIITEMYESGELAETLGVEAPAAAPDDAPEAAEAGAPMTIENRLNSGLEVAAAERRDRDGADRHQVGERPEPQPGARRLGAAERAEVDRQPGEPDGVRRQVGQPRLVERLERQRPGRDGGDVLRGSRSRSPRRSGRAGPAVRPAPKSMKTAIPFAVAASTIEPASESAARIATPAASVSSGISVRSGHQPPSASVSTNAPSATTIT